MMDEEAERVENGIIRVLSGGAQKPDGVCRVFLFQMALVVAMVLVERRLSCVS